MTTLASTLSSVLTKASHHPVVGQLDDADCGPAALLTVIRAFGGKATLPDIRSQCLRDPRGASLADLASCANHMGFSARAASGSLDQLQACTLPCIAHVVNERGRPHYVVVQSIGRTVRIGDPALGPRKLSREHFEEMWKSRAVLLFEDRAPVPPLTLHVPQIQWTLNLLMESKALLAQATFLIMLGTAGSILSSLVAAQLVTRSVPAGQSSSIYALAGALLGIGMARALIGFARHLFVSRASERLVRRLHTVLLEALLNVPERLFHSGLLGNHGARLVDVQIAQIQLLRSLSTIGSDILLLTVTCVVIAFISAALLPFLLIAVGILAIGLRRHFRRLRESSLRVASAYSDLEERFREVLSGSRDLRFANACSFGMNMYEQRVSTFAALQYRVASSLGSLTLSSELIGAMVLSGIVGYAAMHVLGGQLRRDELFMLYIVGGLAVPSIVRVLDSVNSLQTALVAATRIEELQTSSDRSSRSPSSTPVSIALETASLRRAAQMPVWENVNFVVRRGELVTLEGPSGCGKSSLVAVIAGHLRLTTGNIHVEGSEGQRLADDELEHVVALIPATTIIFSGTVLENIALGRPIPALTIQALAVEAGLWSLLERLPNGLHTVVGHGGHPLSAGEQQAIGVLRVLVAKPPFIAIDEGLNALDEPRAAQVLSAVVGSSWRPGVILISHSAKLRALAHTHYSLRVRENRNGHDAVTS